MDNKKNVNEQKFPQFLSNQPCCEDLFEGHSHSTIANNIAALLINNTNCNIVGIDGSWGSGKSNLVNLVERAIKEDKNNKTKFHFFIYDAWGFQNDAQRRSIMENLTAYLINNAKQFNSDTWNKRLLELLTKSRTTGAKITKELNAFVKVSSVNVFLSPLYVKLYKLIPDNLPKCLSWIKTLYWPFLILVSLIVVIILQISEMKKYHEPITIKNFFHDLFYSYLDYGEDKKNVERAIKYETIFEKEPSSRDFLCWIEDIDTTLKNERLVIVFDNMDRLPAKKVQDLWSAINIFFSGSDKKLKNISVIIPFDRLHIKNAFKSENITKTAGNKQGEEQISYGDDFINKTFNVVFRVSPPTMSNWKAFFNDLWKKAFNEDVDYSVSQIYDLLTIENQTPRKMIAFINEFVSIRKIFDKSKIPDEYVSLFIFGKNKIQSNPTGEILKPSFLGALDFKYEKDDDLQKYLSALYYQLDPEQALDLIYTDKIIKALDNKNSLLLKDMKNLSNFYPVLQNAITKITNIPNAVIALNEVLQDESDLEQINTWDCVYKQIDKAENKLQEYQEILLRKITEKEKYLKRILREFINSSEFKSEDYYLSLNHLEKLQIGISIEDYFIEKEVIPEEYIKFVELARNDYRKYKVICNIKELDDYLSKQSPDTLKFLEAFKYIEIDNKDNFSAYESNINKIIDSNPNDEKTVPVMYERLKELDYPVSHKLSDAAIVTLFSKLKPEEDFYYDLICMRISRLANFQGGNSVLVSQIMTKMEPEFTKRVASVMHYYTNFDDLLHNISTMKGYPLYVEVCKELITNKDYKYRANLHQLLSDYQIIKDITKLNAQQIISCFNLWDSFNTITVANITAIPVSYFEDAKENPDKLFEYCKKIATEYLSSKNKNDWITFIETDSYEYKLISTLTIKNEYCHEAFQELMKKKAKGENDKLTKKVAKTLISLALVNGRSLKTLFNDIRDLFCNGNYEMTEPLFDFYGEWLFMYSDLTNKKEALRRILPIRIMEKTCVISVILNNSDTVLKMIRNSEDGGQDFKEKIASMLDNRSNDTTFVDFAKKIGIEKKSENS